VGRSNQMVQKTRHQFQSDHWRPYV